MPFSQFLWLIQTPVDKPHDENGKQKFFFLEKKYIQFLNSTLNTMINNSSNKI